MTDKVFFQLQAFCNVYLMVVSAVFHCSSDEYFLMIDKIQRWISDEWWMYHELKPHITTQLRCQVLTRLLELRCDVTLRDIEGNTAMASARCPEQARLAHPNQITWIHWIFTGCWKCLWRIQWYWRIQWIRKWEVGCGKTWQILFLSIGSRNSCGIQMRCSPRKMCIQHDTYLKTARDPKAIHKW